MLQSVISALAIAVPAAFLSCAPALAEPAPIALTVDGGPTSAVDPAPVRLEADLWLPEQLPAPAVVLAHGFGGSKDAVADQARLLAERGFAVLAYSARGFGGSTGQISMNAPDFEVTDARRIIDELAERPQILTDAPGDPRVGFAGGSYGGALALMVAGYDQRVDAVAADITWNDLESSLFPQSTDAPGPGVYKSLWSALFFSAGLTGTEVTECGRFAADWCRAYTDAATTGRITPASSDLMLASSPRSIAERITAPTLLGAGLADSLFPVSQADATARQIAAAHPEVPLKVVWHAGGHDGGVNESERLTELTAAWMSAHLAGGPPVGDDFEVSLVEASAVSDRAQPTVQVLTSAEYPGLRGTGYVDVPIAGSPTAVLAPAGGEPRSLSTFPGLGGLGALGGLVQGLAGERLGPQSIRFASDPLVSGVRSVGSMRISLDIAADRAVRDGVLFASLQVLSGDRPVPISGLVAPVLMPPLGPDPVRLTIDLPVVVADLAAGDRLAIAIGTTDLGYRLPDAPAVYTIDLVDDALAVPTVPLTATSTSVPAWIWPPAAIAGLLLIAGLLHWVRPRRRGAPRPELAEVPLSIEGLAKGFRNGVKAVDDVSFEVPRGVVLGLLGPNGAGKTTTMRMVTGLIRPSAGTVHVFGEPVQAGAAPLARIGAFIEGPGFLPHLTGRQNLDLFWRASGRADDPRLDAVLEIAGLGVAIDRRVRTYSQGMRQRLGIAQAMLGMPEILLLDEPTNGLDPPQIREMRQVITQYAGTGRTVIISSHLLAEVEQTCTHVVVMHRGRLIAQGRVDELLAGRSGQRLEDVFMEIVGEGHLVVSGS